jgi:hypothetical protein
MSLSLPNPSNRLIRAAAAEQADLTRHRERLVHQRDKLLGEMRRVEDGLATVDERLRVLAQLTDAPQSASAVTRASEVPPTSPATERLRRAEGVARLPVLRGPAIREIAVRVLINQPEHIEALHYRRWYELLGQAGYSVAGKDPLAVFLTQVTRSPVVRKGTQPGAYEVDRQAPLRIRRRLEGLQAELREVTVEPHAPIELASVRARRHELDLAISQQERALEEALRVLRREEPAAASVGASRPG